jgi:hypothetical protein
MMLMTNMTVDQVDARRMTETCPDLTGHYVYSDQSGCSGTGTRTLTQSGCEGVYSEGVNDNGLPNSAYRVEVCPESWESCDQWYINWVASWAGGFISGPPGAYTITSDLSGCVYTMQAPAPGTNAGAYARADAGTDP